MTIEDFIEHIKELNVLEIIPINEHIWVENLNLDWDHKDPADRTIVATAKIKDLPLMTNDRIIKSFYNDIIW